MHSFEFAPYGEKGKRIRDFFELEARSMIHKFRVLETLIPNSRTKGAAHRAEEGRYIESILRDFLNRHLPSGIRAVSGFILCPSTKRGDFDLNYVENHPDKHSRQIDIIVYDFANFPVYERFEEFCIVPPEGVLAIISVKKTLYKSELHGEINSLTSAAELCISKDRRGPHIGLFAFSVESTNRETIINCCFESLKTDSSKKSFELLINEISVLQNFVIFKWRKEHSERYGFAKYVNINCEMRGHIALQRLINSILSVYYDSSRQVRGQRPGFVSFERGLFKRTDSFDYVEYLCS